MMRLRSITLRRERIANWEEYPFDVPAIRSLTDLTIRSRLCFFVGENGSGKSTLLEAVAAHYGFGREGGSRSFAGETTDSVRAIDPLAGALRVAFTNRTGKGFYLRAESFFNVATRVDEIGVVEGYGGVSLHQQSHGESFIALLQHRFRRNGFYVLDEPEAALSPPRQLELLLLLRDLLKSNDEIQFLIASHSPIVLAYPGAQIFSFDNGQITEISYRQTTAYSLMSDFMAAPETFVDELLSDQQLSLES